jgi:hypothetical protein
VNSYHCVISETKKLAVDNGFTQSLVDDLFVLGLLSLFRTGFYHGRGCLLCGHRLSVFAFLPVFFILDKVFRIKALPLFRCLIRTFNVRFSTLVFLLPFLRFELTRRSASMFRMMTVTF